jgi:UPF0755 protein
MKIFKIYGAIFAILLALFSFVFIPTFFRPGVEVDIPVYTNSSAGKIALVLKEKGVIRFALPFRMMAKLTRTDRKLKAGLYRMSPRLSLWRVLIILSQGKSELLTLKVPEGFTVEQIGFELEKMKVTTTADFLTAVRDRDLIKSLGIQGPSLEGYLFPETYRVPLGAGAQALVELMVHQFLESVGPGFDLQCSRQGLRPYQIVILASIVEKEARLDEERALVAGVLYNRLRKKMRLQVNATLNYILNTKNPWFTNEQLNIQSPYNTYAHRGLPPTPICNPGLASLQAVLNPEEKTYLYYVAQGDGSHLFAETWEEHNKNVIRAKKIRRMKRLQQKTAATTPLP